MPMAMGPWKRESWQQPLTAGVSASPAAGGHLSCTLRKALVQNKECHHVPPPGTGRENQPSESQQTKVHSTV